MLNTLRTMLDAMLGRGAYAVTIPVMDGSFLPNQALEEADTVVSAPGLDNLVARGGALLFSSGTTLQKVSQNGGDSETVETFDLPISCLAAGDDGALAIGLDGGGVVIRGGVHDGRRFTASGEAVLNCPTAALFLSDNTLLVANGSRDRRLAEWKHDLMSLGQSGSVWKLDLLTGKSSAIAQGMAFPYGLALGQDGELLVSEAWKHRIVALSLDGSSRPMTRVANLPGYPSRIVPASPAGYWLTLFAARNQLVEFVLRERRYCERMMAEVDPEYWVAPAFTSGRSFKEPIQGDSVKMMGILKPWAPPRSYGLVALCDADAQPIASWHSRANGTAHAITSVAQVDGMLVAGSRGAGRAVRLEIPVARLLESM